VAGTPGSGDWAPQDAPTDPHDAIAKGERDVWKALAGIAFLLGIGILTVVILNGSSSSPSASGPPSTTAPGQAGGPPSTGPGETVGAGDVTLHVVLFAWVPDGKPDFVTTGSQVPTGRPIRTTGCPGQTYPNPCEFDVIMPKGTVLTFSGQAAGGVDPWRFFNHSEGVCPRADTNAAIAQPCTVTFDQNTSLTIYRADMANQNGQTLWAIYPQCPDPAWYAAVNLPPPVCPPTR
jgi:hypothetical protein